MLKFVALLAFPLFAVHAICAPFINLDFEMGSTNSCQLEFRDVAVGLTTKKLTFGTGSTRDLLPGWRVAIGGQETVTMAIGSGYYRWPDPSRIPTHAALLNWGDYYRAFEPVPIDGQFALALDNSRRLADGTAAVLVSQTGDVPAEAEFLTFRSYPTYGVGDLGLLIDDERFDFFDFDQDPNDPTKFKVNISRWAGKQVTLGFFLPHDAPAVVDSIAFSSGFTNVLSISRTPPENGQPPRVTLAFAVEPGRDYFVEFRENLEREPLSLWQVLPGAPHNQGVVVDSEIRSKRFYRLRSQEKPPSGQAVAELRSNTFGDFPHQ
jgi:hypothetical protein